MTTSRKDAREALKYGIEEDGFVLIEEHLSGEEASILVIMDESGYVMLPPSQDHKRVGNNDTGPNTGGMGAYAPAPIVTPSVLARAREEIIEPMHHYLRNSSTPYRGCLYVGLMIDSQGSPSVVEFNVRLGRSRSSGHYSANSVGSGRIASSSSRGKGLGNSGRIQEPPRFDCRPCFRRVSRSRCHWKGNMRLER